MKRMKRIALYIVINLSVLTTYGQNPIIPEGNFMADPSAHVWNDSVIFVYGSVDESATGWCSPHYKAVFSSDMKKWSLSDTIFSSIGPNDGISYTDNALGAPDVQFRNNIYYIYYCKAGEDAEGVASSSSPLGPFLNGKKINVGEFNEIDPAVFIDDDGQAYYLWGQFKAKIAKMKPNMTEIDTTTIVEGIVTEEDHYFHEGIYMVKRNSLYYLVYADISRGGAPTCIGYSYSHSPMGPYEYGGVIIDNKFCDPKVWNNHGSLEEFNTQWYVFYQRSSNGSASLRKVCVEPIYFREDGTIPEVQMTSQGATGPLNVFDGIDASTACMVKGNIRISTMDSGNEVLAEAFHGDQAVFKYLDFGDGADSISIRVCPSHKPCNIRVSLGPWIGDLALIDVPAKNEDEWITIKAPITSTKGVHELWLTFYDQEGSDRGIDISSNDKNQINGGLCKLDMIKFF